MTRAKTSRLNVRVAPDDARLFRHAAALAEESLSEFLVAGARARAERLLADRNVFALDASAWEELAEALDRPPAAIPAVTDLLARRHPA